MGSVCPLFDVCCLICQRAERSQEQTRADVSRAVILCGGGHYCTLTSAFRQTLDPRYVTFVSRDNTRFLTPLSLLDEHYRTPVLSVVSVARSKNHIQQNAFKKRDRDLLSAHHLLIHPICTFSYLKRQMFGLQRKKTPAKSEFTTVLYCSTYGSCVVRTRAWRGHAVEILPVQKRGGIPACWTGGPFLPPFLRSWILVLISSRRAAPAV